MGKKSGTSVGQPAKGHLSKSAPPSNTDGAAFALLFIVGGSIVYVVLRLMWESWRTSQLICRACGTVGSTKRHMPGSIIIEVILWCCFLVPGIIYTIWRHSATKRVCAVCGGSELVPKSTPLGRETLARVQSQMDSAKKAN